jgi:hypothetical protein
LPGFASKIAAESPLPSGERRERGIAPHAATTKRATQKGGEGEEERRERKERV